MINTIIYERMTRLLGQGEAPRYDIGPPERSPRLALVADLHSNELNGIFVLSRLAAFLRSIEAGERRELRLRERVIIIPSMDALGMMSHTRRLSGDRYRIMESVSEAVIAMTRTAYYRVNVCAANCDIEEMPQVLLYAPSDDERASACLFGLPAVVEQPAHPDETGELARTWRPYGGENFVIRAGQSGNLQPRYCEILLRALVAFLDRIGVIEGLQLAESEEDLHYFGRRQACEARAQQSGIFSSSRQVGQWVRAGEELGQIHNNFTGDLRSRVLAPVAGLLAGLRRQPLVCAGDLVARILTLDRAFRRGSAQRFRGHHYGQQTG